VPDLYEDPYSDAYDTGSSGGGGSGLFNATRAPRIIVQAAFSVPIADCILGSGILGTDTIGGTTMVDITADVRAITITRGRDSDVDHANPGACTILLGNASGDYDPLNLSGPYVAAGVSLVDIGVAVTVDVEWPTGQFYRRFTGKIADISMDAGLFPTATFTCADGLEDLGRAYLAVEPPVFDGDTTGDRINNLADRAGWPTLDRAIDTGNDILGPTILGGSALELMRQVEQTEFGLLWVDGAGILAFYDRFRAQNANRSVTVQAALTDTSGPGELGMVELELSLSRERIYNTAAATREASALNPDGDEPVEQTASDAASIAKYGTLNLPVEVGTLKTTDAQVKAMLEGIVNRFADGQVRIRQVRINAFRGQLWATLLPLTLLDRISVSRNYGPNTISRQLLIQGFSEEIAVSPARWEITLSTSEPPPAEDYCQVGVGVLGTDLLGW